jgi:carboxylesterase type B
MQNPSTPLVKTRQGILSGTSEENIHIWRGIPYAAPPVGDLRWRSPQPAARWQGVRRAETFSASSWQDIEYCRPPPDRSRCRLWSGCTAGAIPSAREVCRPMTAKP